MIRVLVQHIEGDGEPRELARMDIENVTPQTVNARLLSELEIGEYSVKAATRLPNGDTRLTQRGIHGYRRKRYNVWGLVSSAITSMGREILVLTETLELPE